MANLVGLEGSRVPNRTHSAANTGANRMMNIGVRAWYQLAGKACPRTVFWVFRSAKRLSVEPACSYAIQKMDDATNSTVVSTSRFRSSVDHWATANSQAKK